MEIKHFERLDRRLKWVLLITSLAVLGIIIAQLLMERRFAQWQVLRREYATILRAKATDASGRAAADKFEIKIDQNFLQGLNAVDRCIACHAGVDDPRMANEKQPFRTHSGNYMKAHLPERFGCTICHRGQGRAIVSDEAKAVGHHWDYPILPVNLTQSSCGICHTAKEVADSGGEKYASGKMLFEAKGCRACHKLNGRGGSLGPALDNEGLRVRGQLPMVHVTGVHTLPQWLMEHFDNPQKIVPTSRMKPPQLSREENELITIYMLSLQNRDLPKSYITAEKHQEYFKAARPDPASGEELYATFCAVCHDTGKFGRYDKFFGKFIPAVRGTSFVQMASPSYVDAMIRLGRPGTIMPAWGSAAGGLSDPEIVSLRAYVLNSPIEPVNTMPDEIVAVVNNPEFTAHGDTAHGGAIFIKHCAACHAPTGKGLLGPSIVNQVFQKNATDGFLYATVAVGRRNTAMPAFLAPGRGGFTESDIADVITFVRILAQQNKAQNPSGAKAELHAKPKETP